MRSGLMNMISPVHSRLHGPFAIAPVYLATGLLARPQNLHHLVKSALLGMGQRRDPCHRLSSRPHPPPPAGARPLLARPAVTQDYRL